jgi:hypothetical protein
VAAQKLDVGTQWFFANSKDADLRDRQSTDALFKRVKPTHVLHLAAHVGGMLANMKSQVEFWRDNVTMQGQQISLLQGGQRSTAGLMFVNLYFSGRGLFAHGRVDDHEWAPALQQPRLRLRKTHGLDAGRPLKRAVRHQLCHGHPLQ